MASEEHFQRKLVEQVYGGGTSDFDHSLTDEQRRRLYVLKAYPPYESVYKPSDDGSGGTGAFLIIVGGFAVYLISVIADFIDRSPNSLLIFLGSNIIAFTLSVRFLYRNFTKKKQVKRKKLYLILSWIFLLFSGSILTLFVVLCFKGEF